MRLLYRYLFIIGFVFFASTVFGKDDTEKNSEKLDNSLVIDRIVNNDIEVSVPSVVFAFKETTIKLKFKNPEHTKLLLNNNKLHFIINGEDTELTFINGESSFTLKFSDTNTLSIYIEEFSYNQQITVCPLWIALLVAGLIILILLRRFLKKKKRKIIPGAN